VPGYVDLCHPFINPSSFGSPNGSGGASISSINGPAANTNFTAELYGYLITGPTAFGTGSRFTDGELLSGTPTFLCGNCTFRFPSLSISPEIRSGDPIDSRFIFRNLCLSDLGLGYGLVAEWALIANYGGIDAYNANDKIRLYVEQPSPPGPGTNLPSAPAPLGALGGISAFYHSRKLRNRLKKALN